MRGWRICSTSFLRWACLTVSLSSLVVVLVVVVVVVVAKFMEITLFHLKQMTRLLLYNRRADNVTIYTKWQLRLLSSVTSCYIKRNNKWVDEDIDSFQFGSFINSLRQKEPLCCKLQEEEKTVLNSCAGI